MSFKLRFSQTNDLTVKKLGKLMAEQDKKRAQELEQQRLNNSHCPKECLYPVHEEHWIGLEEWERSRLESQKRRQRLAESTSEAKRPQLPKE